MNIRYLEIMEAIEETGSFTKAAKKLYITQSAVSHAVAELESETGTALFERQTRGVKATSCGKALLEESKSILVACRNLERRLPHIEEDTPIYVVSSITFASFVLPNILKRFYNMHSNANVKVKVARASSVLDLLRHGEADIAFWEGNMPRGDFEILKLGSYELQAACSFDFFADTSPMTLEELCVWPLLLREKGSAIRDTFDRMLAAESLEAQPVWESVNSFSLAKAAEAGLGITILPKEILSDFFEAGRLREVKIKSEPMYNQMFALYNKNQYITKPFRLLLDALQLDR